MRALLTLAALALIAACTRVVDLAPVDAVLSDGFVPPPIDGGFEDDAAFPDDAAFQPDASIGFPDAELDRIDAGSPTDAAIDARF